MLKIIVLKLDTVRGTLAPLLKTLQLVWNWYVIVIYSDNLSKFPCCVVKKINVIGKYCDILHGVNNKE